MVRVLKHDGYFLYADLVFPGWLAALGRKVVRRNAGFPTVRDIEAFQIQEGLSPVHLCRSAVHNETVCRLAR